MAFQQQLKTYIDRNNLNYKYEEKQIAEQQFKARVIIYNSNNDNNDNTITYEWTDSQISKKIAKNEAAKIVLIKLKIIENNDNENNDNENNIENNNENIKDILIDIRNLLKIIVDRTPPYPLNNEID